MRWPHRALGFFFGAVQVLLVLVGPVRCESLTSFNALRLPPLGNVASRGGNRVDLATFGREQELVARSTQTQKRQICGPQRLPSNVSICICKLASTTSLGRTRQCPMQNTDTCFGRPRPRPERHPCASPGACSAQVFSIYDGWIIHKSFGDFEPGPPPLLHRRIFRRGRGSPGEICLHEINPLPRAGTSVPVSTPVGTLITL